MELLPTTLLHQLPCVAYVAREANPTLYAKFFLTVDWWRFYLAATDGQGTRVYSYCGTCIEPCAYWTSYGIVELKRMRDRLGYPVQRDSTFVCCYLSELHPYRLCS